MRYLVSPLAGNPTSEIMSMFARFMLEPPFTLWWWRIFRHQIWINFEEEEFRVQVLERIGAFVLWVFRPKEFMLTKLCSFARSRWQNYML
jgi:hypothetical protein